MGIGQYNSLGSEPHVDSDTRKLNTALYGKSGGTEYGIKDRLAIRLAKIITDGIVHNRFDENDNQLIFDALVDGLSTRTEDELLSLIK